MKQEIPTYLTKRQNNGATRVVGKKTGTRRALEKKMRVTQNE
jgi:hypothetical protein